MPGFAPLPPPPPWDVVNTVDADVDPRPRHDVSVNNKKGWTDCIWRTGTEESDGTTARAMQVGRDDGANRLVTLPYIAVLVLVLVSGSDYTAIRTCI